MQNGKKKKWYNTIEMVGTLLFVFPPVGIYGLYKSDTISSKWKNMVYIVLAMVILFFSILFLT